MGRSVSFVVLVPHPEGVETDNIRVAFDAGADSADLTRGWLLGLVQLLYFGGTVWAADSNRYEAIPGGTWTFDSGVGSSIVGVGFWVKDAFFTVYVARDVVGVHVDRDGDEPVD